MFTVTETNNTGDTIVAEFQTKQGAETFVNCRVDTLLRILGATGGIAARWYDITLYFGSVDEWVKIQTKRTK